MPYLTFIALQVRDRAVSRKFYVDLLGFTVDPATSQPAADVLRQDGGATLALRDPLHPLPGDSRLGTGAILWISTGQAVEELYDVLSQNAVSVLQPPFTTPFGRALMISDPDGYVLTLLNDKPSE